MEVNIIRKKDISTKGYYYIKLIALITMLFDHIPSIIDFPDTTEIAFHSIGRIAFPLFAWELVRCYGYSLNKTKHLFSLCYIALFSEPMFDLLFSHKAMDWQIQNVCFTLCLGWICLFILDYDWIGVEICRKKGIFKDNEKKYAILSAIQWLVRIAFCIVIGIISQITNCDYGVWGIGLIVLLGIADKIHKITYPLEIVSLVIYMVVMGMQNINIGLGMFMYAFCLADIVIIGYYRYKYIPKTDKGVNKALRLFCKWFYPVHLLILFIIGMIIALN